MGDITQKEKARDPRQGNQFATRRLGRAKIIDVKTLGWSDCGCKKEWRAGVVLDPFVGSGTACLVARKLNRDYIGIDINPAYVAMARKRLAYIPDRLTMFLNDDAEMRIG